MVYHMVSHAHTNAWLNDLQSIYASDVNIPISVASFWQSEKRLFRAGRTRTDVAS